LIFSRQYVYDVGGGPVWSVRPEQLGTITPQQRPWVVRLDTTQGNRSDWLFEREWRIPLPTLPVTTDNLVGVLIGDPNWQPIRHIPTGYYRSGATGELVHPHEPYAQPDTYPAVPALWNTAPVRVCWDPATQQITQITQVAHTS